jgi:hypothetical protein
VSAAPDLPLRVGVPVPALLDLSAVEAMALIPRDARDPAQSEAARLAWAPLAASVAGAPSVRLLLPSGPLRLPMLLAASQALKARQPQCRLYLAFDPKGSALLDEVAWGAVEGGALTPEDLGPDPDRWRARLVQAQEQFPGRSWTLWTPVDPGPRAAQLLGDGGRLVVPAGGPGALLAQNVPPGFSDVEGGLGDLTLRHGQTGQALRWTFTGGQWVMAGRFREAKEVQVTDSAAYEIGSLLARMRAAQLRDRSAIRTSMATADYAMHFQGERGNSDLGFVYEVFEQAGEPEEGLREKVTFNGVAAKLHGEVQLPIVEARTTLATPVALALSERYRYADGGPAGPGVRLLRFAPVEQDPLLPSGELTVNETTGRILEERSRRSGLPGVVRSESRILVYGEPAPGFWRVMTTRSTERWMLGGQVTQVRRTITYRDFQLNTAGFEAARERARRGNGSMIQQTLEGVRYYTKQQDGTRKAQERAPSRGMGVAGVLLMDPNADTPVLPLAGMLFFDFNAFDRGIQYSFLTAILYNNLNVTVPNVAAGVDFHAGTVLSALGGTERPVVRGELQNRDGVQRRTQALDLDLSRELGAGFRLTLAGAFAYDQFSDPKEDKYHTPGFLNPPSGLTTFGRTQLTWQRAGFQARTYYGLGQRPEGSWGAPGALQEIPDQGRYRRWGGALAYDVQLGGGVWFQTTLGGAAGANFDRFQAIDFGGMVSGIKPHAIVADRLTYGALRLTIPTGPHVRLDLGLDHGRARSLDDQRTYGFTGLNVAGDLPGFWWFTTVRVELGIGLQSDIQGVKTVSGMISFVRIL